jgi:HlyD family secretion protein
MQRAEHAPEAKEKDSSAVVRLVVPDLRGQRRRRRIVVAIVLVLLAVGGFFLWRSLQTEVDRVRSEPVIRRSVVRTIAITGHIDVERRMEVPAPVGGRLIRIEVRVGDHVGENHELAYLDPRGARIAQTAAEIQVIAASSQVGSARVAFDAANTELQRVLQLIERGLASEADLATARAAVTRSQAALRAAVAQRNAAENGVAGARMASEWTVLRAPMAGVILRAPENVGALVGPERGSLFVIGSDLSSLRIDAAIGEADIGEVRVGQNATFEVPAFAGRRFTATVTRVDPQANVDPGSTTYPVHFRAENPDGRLMQGMSAMLQVQVATADNVLTVPEAALRYVPEGASNAPPRSRVWKHAGPNHLEPVDVVAGVSDGSVTEVRPVRRGALREHDRVAIGVTAVDEGPSAGLSLGRGPRTNAH